MTSIKLAGAALNQTPLDWDNNLKNIKQAISAAQSESVDILCLPELCITGYGCEDLFLSRWLPAKALSYLEQISEWCDDITVSVGLPVWFDDTLYNCACLIHHKEILGFIPKQQLAKEGVHYEPRWFTGWTPGRLERLKYQGKWYPFGDQLYEVHNIEIGFEICEDAWSGDLRPGGSLFKRGVQLVLNPSASHFAFYKSAFRENLVTESSRKFNCVYLYSNLLGNESGRMIFDGDIFIAQQGKLLQRNVKLSFQPVNLTCATVNFKDPGKSTAELKNDDSDLNEEFTKAVTLALFDYLRKSRSKGFVLSLSGGADSSTCAVLVAEMIRRGLDQLGEQSFLEALGISTDSEFSENQEITKVLTRELLTCVYQSTENSSEKTLASAISLSQELGAGFHHWNIDQEVNSYSKKVEEVLGRNLVWELDDTALQNIQARTRAPAIWMLANIKNALLISTSNRSEGDVGYATMDGDTCGSIAPIAAIDKKFILQWLVWAEKHLGYKSLSAVNQLQPTAELRPLELHQTDEADLMPYDIIVEIERLAIKDHLSPLEVFQNLQSKNIAPVETLAGYIAKFFRLWSKNQWKRERIAPSFHLDEFNIDPKTWCRFPILSAGFTQEINELEQLRPNKELSNRT
ncbi:MAG: NAD(+) synthase [Cyclobacteriaceae bacterium]|nr:MAG: NAD(+) synthase [Cyclobacteriaceae bacterium]